MTDVVIDLGCYSHGRHDSIKALAETYNPKLLLGFDPLCGPYADSYGDSVWRTTIVQTSSAAWLWNGRVSFESNGMESTVLPFDSADYTVECFDLEAMLRALRGLDVVLKLDVEGAEYVLLAKLAGAEVWPSLVLVEWHGRFDPEGERREVIVRAAKVGGVPLEEWWM